MLSAAVAYDRTTLDTTRIRSAQRQISPPITLSSTHGYSCRALFSAANLVTIVTSTDKGERLRSNAQALVHASLYIEKIITGRKRHAIVSSVGDYFV